MTYTQLFIRFLKQNNIFHLYKKYIIKTTLKKIYDMNNAYCMYLLSQPFKWKNTNEGFDFWLNINNKWVEKLFEYNKIDKDNCSFIELKKLYCLKANDII